MLRACANIGDAFRGLHIVAFLKPLNRHRFSRRGHHRKSKLTETVVARAQNLIVARQKQGVALAREDSLNLHRILFANGIGGLVGYKLIFLGVYTQLPTFVASPGPNFTGSRNCEAVQSPTGYLLDLASVEVLE